MRHTSVRLFLTCWLIYGLHFATNVVREVYPALSLGDNLSFDVSEYYGLHPDIFRLPSGESYINNNPGASILGAVPYALARPVIDPIVANVEKTRAQENASPREYDSIYPLAQDFYQESFERGLDVKFGLAAGVMQVFLMAPMSALSVVMMFYVLRKHVGSRVPALLLALLYGFATPIFYRTAQLNHNLLQSHFAFFAFLLLWWPWDKAMLSDNRRYALAGLLAGWTLVLDYSGVVLLGGLGLYALFGARSKWDRTSAVAGTGSFVGGSAVAILILLAYQWAAFGNPLLPAQHYMPETAFSGAGYQGLDWPQLDLIGLLTFGMRYGLFTSAPLLILALYPPAWRQGRSSIVGRREALFILGVSLAFLLFTAANQFARMQFNTGVRHMVPVVPFLFLIVAGALQAIPRWVAVAVSILGTYWSWCLAMYRDVEQGLGVFESIRNISLGGPRLPWLTTLEQLGFIRPGLAPLVLAFALLVVALIWIIPIGRLPAVQAAAAKILPLDRINESLLSNRKER